MHHDGTDAHLSVQHQINGKDDDQHHAYLLDKRLQALVDVTGLTRLQLIVQHIHLYIVLLLPLQLLTHEALDHRDRVDDVDQPVILTLALAAQLHAPPLQPPGLSLAHVEVGRHNDCRQQPHIEIGMIHHHQGDDGSGEERQDIEEEVLHQPYQALHT